MVLKKRTTKCNIWALPLIFCVGLAANAFYNTQSLALLKNPEHFNVPKSEIGRTSSNIIFWATFVSLFTTIASGYCFDLFGRKIPIFASFITMVGLIWLLPYLGTILQLIACRSLL